MGDSIIPTVPSTTENRTPEYLIIGNVTKDIVPDGERQGGTAAYAGLTALAWGASTALVTSCPPGCSLSALDGMLIQKVPSGRETVFVNRYHDGVREQWIRSLAENLGPVHIPKAWLTPSIVHLAPVAGEVEPGLFDLFPHSLRCVTLQGWMRALDADGKVRHAVQPEAELAARGADAAVFSMDDVDRDVAEAERLARMCPACAVTDGAQGCRVFWRGEVQAFRAPTQPEIDPTGAGDIFAALFFLRLKETGNAWEAARMATVLASSSVTRMGLLGVPTREEILDLKRAEKSP
jgi:sugar/nucleoside kinase (ribokinase family)